MTRRTIAPEHAAQQPHAAPTPSAPSCDPPSPTPSAPPSPAPFDPPSPAPFDPPRDPPSGPLAATPSDRTPSGPPSGPPSPVADRLPCAELAYLSAVSGMETLPAGYPAAEATGTDSGPLAARLLFTVIGNYLAAPESYYAVLPATLEALRGIAPRDPAEGMLAAQMVAVHNAAMDSLGIATAPDSDALWRDAEMRHAARLMALYARQLELLDRRRARVAGGRVSVGRVNVAAGGQAVVGTVHAGGRAAPSPSTGEPRPGEPAPPDGLGTGAEIPKDRGRVKPPSPSIGEDRGGGATHRPARVSRE